MSTPLTLADSVRLIGHYRHAELCGHAALAPRALLAQGGDARLVLLRAAAAHAHRAGLLEVLLPVSATLPDATSLTVPIDGRIETAFAAVCAAGDAAAIGGLCRVVYRALSVSYLTHIERCSPFADAPVALVLRRCVDDLSAVCAEAEAVEEVDETLLASLEDALSAGVRVDDGPDETSRLA